MSQQINLFNPIFLKQKKYFSAQTMAQALGMILLGCTLLTAYVRYQVSALGKEAEATAAQLASVQVQLNRVNAAFAPRQKSKTLEEAVLKTEGEIKSLQLVFDVLQKGEFGNTRGYAEFMRAFSRQIVNGLWLTEFTIHGAGAEIGLRGRALQPDLVPAYINRLKRESALQGKSFATLDMQVPSPGQTTDNINAVSPRTQPAYIEFNLQSSGALKEGSESSGAKSK